MKNLCFVLIAIIASSVPAMAQYTIAGYDSCGEPIEGFVSADDEYRFVVEGEDVFKLTDLSWSLQFAVYDEDGESYWLRYHMLFYPTYKAGESDEFIINRDSLLLQKGVPVPANPIEGMVVADDSTGVKAQIILEAVSPTGEVLTVEYPFTMDWRPVKPTGHYEDVNIEFVFNEYYSDWWKGTYTFVVDETLLADGYRLERWDIFAGNFFNSSIYIHEDSAIFSEVECYPIAFNKYGSRKGDAYPLTDYVGAVNDAKTEGIARLYPTIATDYIQVESSQTIDFIDIYNIDGQCVKREYDKFLNISSLSKGHYIVKVVFKNGTSSTHRFVKR